MNNNIFILIIFICSANAANEPSAVTATIDNTITDCKYEPGLRGLGRMHIEQIKQHEEEGKKLLSCVMGRLGLIKNGQVQPKLAIAVMKNIYKMKREHIDYIVNKCTAFIGNNDSETVGMITSCIGDHIIYYEFFK